MKFPKLFGKKKSEDEDEEDFDPADFEDADEESGGEADVVNPHADVDEDMEVGGPAKADAATSDHDDDEEYDEDEDDDEYEDDNEEEEDEDAGSAKKKAILFAAFGGFIVLLSALGGAGWWYFTSSHAKPTIAAAPKPGETKKQDDGSIALSMPSKSGSLNAAAGSGGMSLNQLAAGTGGDQAPASEQTAMPAPAPTQPAPAAPEPASASPAGQEPSAQETETAQPAADAGTSLNSLNSLNATQSIGGGVVVPAVGSTMLASIPDHPAAADQKQALTRAPVRNLLEDKPGVKGQLPKISDNGVQPWQAYARPADATATGPKIALIMENIGLSRSASMAAIHKLPPQISLVMSPYGLDLKDWLFRSRLAGHEVFISLPMESDNFPMDDPGPLGLDTRVQVVENEKRLDTVLASVGGYVGVVTLMGSKFMKAEGQLRRVMQPLKSRGLMFVIGGSKKRSDAPSLAAELGLPRAESEIYIDDEPRIQPIRENLDKLESLAKSRGFAVATARPYPVTIKAITDWEKTLKDKQIFLVPVSSVAQGVAGN